MGLSIKRQLTGAVMLTGGVGFLGSVCLERLLALTEVSKVYLLVRGKKGLTAQQRVQKLLCGPLFHQLHQQAAASNGPNVFSRVCVVQGDLEQPGLGLTQQDREALQEQVEVIIHSAAVLTLDAHIQSALRSNFVGTQHLLELAVHTRRLRSFVYLSTYYTSNFLPCNTPVKEQVHYPTLQLAGDPQQLTSNQLADLLLSLPPDTAAAEVSHIMARLNMSSTYAFSKLLSEQLLDNPATLPSVSKAIVRPSLIASMAGPPYPGYISGFAGAPGYSLAYAMGFFHDISSVAFASDAIVDIIPVDTTAALVIAAAAAAAAHGPYAGGHARVYHAASAASYPERAPTFFAALHDFFTTNPPPFRLPFTQYPTFSGRHDPTEGSMAAGMRITGAKVWLVAKVLQLSGKSRQARMLQQAFRAFCVQDSPRYARSIVSCVKHALHLQYSLAPEEQQHWRCVWQEGPDVSWSAYTATALTGLRAIALRQPPEEVKGGQHGFKLQHGLSDTHLMATWMAAANPHSSSRSSSGGRGGGCGSTTAGISSNLLAKAVADAGKASQVHSDKCDMHGRSIASGSSSSCSTDDDSDVGSEAGSIASGSSSSCSGGSGRIAGAESATTAAVQPGGVLQQSGVKRSRSCHAMLVSAK